MEYVGHIVGHWSAARKGSSQEMSWSAIAQKGSEGVEARPCGQRECNTQGKIPTCLSLMNNCEVGINNGASGQCETDWQVLGHMLAAEARDPRC